LKTIIPQLRLGGRTITTNIVLPVEIPDCVMKGHFSYAEKKKVIVFFITDVLNIEGNSLLNLSFEQRHNSLNKNVKLMNYFNSNQSVLKKKGLNKLTEVLNPLIFVIQPYIRTNNMSISDFSSELESTLSNSLSRYNILDVKPKAIVVGGLDDNYLENCTHTILSTTTYNNASFTKDFFWQLKNKKRGSTEVKSLTRNLSANKLQQVSALVAVMKNEDMKRYLTTNLNSLVKFKIQIEDNRISAKCFHMLDLPRRTWLVTESHNGTTVRIDRSPPITIFGNKRWVKLEELDIELYDGSNLKFRKLKLVKSRKKAQTAWSSQIKRTMYKVSRHINIIVDEKRSKNPIVYLEVVPGDHIDEHYSNVIKAIQTLIYTISVMKSKVPPKASPKRTSPKASPKASPRTSPRTKASPKASPRTSPRTKAKATPRTSQS